MINRIQPAFVHFPFDKLFKTASPMIPARALSAPIKTSTLLSQDFQLTHELLPADCGQWEILVYSWDEPSWWSRKERMMEKRIKVYWPRKMENVALILIFQVWSSRDETIFCFLEVYEGTCSNLTINPCYWGLIICANAMQWGLIDEKMPTDTIKGYKVLQ